MHGSLRKMSSLTSHRIRSRQGAKKIFGFLKRLVLRGVSLLASGCPTEVPAPSTISTVASSVAFWSQLIQAWESKLLNFSIKGPVWVGVLI